MSENEKTPTERSGPDPRDYGFEDDRPYAANPSGTEKVDSSSINLNVPAGEGDAPPLTPEQLTRLNGYARSWHRYFAKSVDITLGITVVGFVFGILIGLFRPQYLPVGILQETAFGAVMLFVAIAFEAIMISRLGTTPGKLLFKTRITDANGNRLSLPRSLKRSYYCLFAGLGLGLPLFGLIGNLAGRYQLENNGVTIWDRASDAFVHHGDMSPIWIVFAISVCVLMIAYQIYLQFLTMAF